MRNQKLFISLAALLTSTAMLATASPVVAQTVRAEIHGGWDHLSGDVRKDGLVYGIGAGVDFRLGNTITVGVEGNADLSNVNECAGDVLAADDELCVSARRDLSAVARVGVNVTSGTQIYALAGYTNGRFRTDYDPANGAPTRTFDNLDGARVGAGVQHTLGGRLYSKLEYRYSNYEGGAERHQVIGGLGMVF